MNLADKQCGCGVFHNAKGDLCGECRAKAIGTFWTAKDNYRVTMYSDGNQFVAQILAGMAENYLSVGHSVPNNAWICEEMIPELCKALDEQWEKTEELELEKMLPSLLKLCEVANSIYNKFVFGELP